MEACVLLLGNPPFEFHDWLSSIATTSLSSALDFFEVCIVKVVDHNLAHAKAWGMKTSVRQSVKNHFRVGRRLWHFLLRS